MIEIRKKTSLKKMPKSCLRCKFGLKDRFYGERYCQLLSHYVGTTDYEGYTVPHDGMNEETHRHEDCPLVEVNN